MAPSTMNRREAIQRMALLMGGTMIGPRLLAAAMAADPAKGAVGVSADELALLDEIGETIIPATDIPGAKAMHIGAFITMMLRDCYDAADVAAVDGGVQELAQNFRLKYGHEFIGASATERTEFLNAIDRDQQGASLSRKSDAPAHYFRILKELTVIGYFSSEIGATQALRFIEVPGRFDGNAPYQKGDHAWFS